MNSGKASSLEHLTARNSVHYFCSLVRRRADSESLQAPQVASTLRHRSPREPIFCHMSNSPGCFSPIVNCCTAIPVNGSIDRGRAANLLW